MILWERQRAAAGSRGRDGVRAKQCDGGCTEWREWGWIYVNLLLLYPYDLDFNHHQTDNEQCSLQGGWAWARGGPAALLGRKEPVEVIQDCDQDVAWMRFFQASPAERKPCSRACWKHHISPGLGKGPQIPQKDGGCSKREERHVTCCYKRTDKEICKRKLINGWMEAYLLSRVRKPQ